jgi:hypothetical protein
MCKENTENQNNAAGSKSAVDGLVSRLFWGVIAVFTSPITWASRGYELWHFGPSQRVLNAGRAWREMLIKKIGG